MVYGPGMFRPLLLLVLASCSSKSEAPPEQPPPADAPAAPLDTITEIGNTDPNRFTDPDPTRRTPATKPPRNRPSRPIDIILKSSPPGADAAVDGVIVGRTPAYWYGEADGHEHEFTFVMNGHNSARYRFVPIQSGTVHAKLDVTTDEVPDAGVADPVTAPKQPSFMPDPTPAPIDTPKPPDTVIAPGSGSAQGSQAVGSGGSAGDSSGNPGAKGPQP